MTLRNTLAGFLPFKKPSLTESQIKTFTEVPSADTYIPSADEQNEVMADIAFWHPSTIVDTKSGIWESKASVAFVADEDTLSFGVAFCSPNDQFSRPRGRDLALERLANEPFIIETPRPLHASEARRLIASVVLAGDILGLAGYPHSQRVQFTSL